MTQSRFRRVVGVLVAGSLFVSSTGAVASASQPTPPQVNPWAALAALSGGAPAAAICGAAAAAAVQTAGPGCVLPVIDAPPPIAQNPPPPPVPVPPIAGPASGFGIEPLYLALAAVAAGAGLYFLLKKKNDNKGTSPS